jgi:hypothetical protein
VVRHNDYGPPKYAEAEQEVRGLCSWRGADNVYRAGVPMLRHESAAGRGLPAPGVADQKGWDEFWGQKEPDGVRGEVAFAGVTPWKDLGELTPADFRLRPGSAGHRAGKGGRDAGADLDLLGPDAYERWEETPAHAAWRKATGQR